MNKKNTNSMNIKRSMNKKNITSIFSSIHIYIYIYIYIYQSRAPAELFCRGYFPPGGGNHCHHHHQRSSHREREISINIFTSTILSPSPSSSLVSNSCPKVQDWC